MIKPSTFAEAMRGLMALALFGGGIVCTAFAVWTLLIVWKGEWPIELASRRLDLIGMALLASLLGIGLVIVSLAIGGPLGRVKAAVFGSTFEAEGDIINEAPK